MNKNYRDFISGIAQVLDCDISDADSHWAAFSRDLSDSEREQIEDGGLEAGIENGRAILALK